MPIRTEGFRYEHDAATGVATVTLDRPERLNALTFDSYEAIRDAFRALDTEPGVRAIVLTGEGRAFCSGGDVEEIIAKLFDRKPEGLLAFMRLAGELIGAICHCRRPVIAALNGPAVGAGAVMTAASDIRIAAENAKIAYLFPKVGLSGADMGTTWLLPRLIGHSRASEILLTGRFVEPDEALRIGLYHAVVPKEKVLEEARGRAEVLGRGPTFALGVTKRMLTREAHMDLDEALEAEAHAQAKCMEHSDFREAYEARTAKREPEFRDG